MNAKNLNRKQNMPTKNKTTETKVTIEEFIDSFVERDEKKEESYHLIKLMKALSGFEPKMWGHPLLGLESIITNTPAGMKEKCH